jgi:hypothetical protein
LEAKLLKLIEDMVDGIKPESNVNYNEALAQTASCLANVYNVLKNGTKVVVSGPSEIILPEVKKPVRK